MNDRKSFGDQLLEIRTFIDYGMFMPEIITRLSPFGFGPKEMLKGRKLLDNTHVEQEQSKSKNEIDCEKYSIKFNEIYEDFSKHRGRAKVVFRNNEYILNNFLAVGKSSSVLYSDWLITAKRFYHNALASREVIFSFSKVMVSERELRNTLRNIEVLERIQLKQVIEEETTILYAKIRNENFSKLKEWYNEAISIARIALVDMPHILEALGIEASKEQ